MQRKQRLLSILLGINLLMTLAVILFLFINHSSTETPLWGGNEEVTYTLYIGLNDKDTYTQLIAADEARARVDDICLRHVDGFTVSEAQGSWTDEDGVPTHENTLVYMFTGASEPQITAIMDEVLIELNQSSILVSTDNWQTAYYSREKQTEA